VTALDQRTPDVFAAFADTLADEFDLVEFLNMVAERCVALLDVTAAGLVLVDQHGSANLTGASDRFVRPLELRYHEGPSLDAFRRGQVVHCPDLRHAPWPRFAAAAVAAGYGAVHALPMRLRGDVIGGLSLFTVEPGTLDEERLALALALAKTATIGILARRAIHHRETLVEQLQVALDSRVLIEQAKGVLAERLQITVAAAFTLLRTHARNTSQRLHDIAAMVVNGSADTFTIN
jgi:GAF domain-containing protein